MNHCRCGRMKTKHAPSCSACGYAREIATSNIGPLAPPARGAGGPR